MAKRTSLIGRHQVYGELVTVAHLDEGEIIGITGDEGLEEKIETLIKGRHKVFELRGTTSVFYRVKDTEEYDDRMNAKYVKEVNEDTYEWGMHINPYCDQLTWATNVDTFFEMMVRDPKAVADINACCFRALNTRGSGGKTFNLEKMVDDCRVYLRNVAGNERNKGKRRFAVKQYLIKAKTGRLWNKAEWWVKNNLKTFKK